MVRYEVCIAVGSGASHMRTGYRTSVATDALQMSSLGRWVSPHTHTHTGRWAAPSTAMSLSMSLSWLVIFFTHKHQHLHCSRRVRKHIPRPPSSALKSDLSKQDTVERRFICTCQCFGIAVYEKDFVVYFYILGNAYM